MKPVTLFAVALFAATGVLGDQWSLPKEMAFESSDGGWRVVISPRALESQLAYFTGKVAGESQAGSARSSSDDHARATLYRKGRFRTWHRMARWKLVNDVSPVSALVALDGTVVTFDNWHGMGYGDDVIVIYRPDGTLLRKLGLEDLLEPYDISQLRHSVSSIWWSGTHRLDATMRRLIVQVDTETLTEFPISLDTGELLVPKRALYPPPHVSWNGLDMKASRCGSAIALSAKEVTDHAVTTDLPTYPTVAQKARIAGEVILEVMIDEAGLVTEATVLKPLPFGIADAAQGAVRQWTFSPMVREGTTVPACAVIKMTFALR